ncbi:MAG: hypothetical protein IH985_07020 [Planctomycetes bacterium]|nr:hypothetical protein [Planctomycetota bacterium]
MAAHLKPHPPTTPRPPALEGQVEFTCIKCEYSLAGLAIDGSCPECGTSIQHSIHGNRLDYADPAFIARLARGATLLKFSINCVVALIIVALAGLILSMILTLVFDRDLVELSWGVLGVAAVVLGLLSVITWLMGSLHLLTPDPNGSETLRVAIARARARAYGKFACVSILVLVGAQFVFESFGGDASIFSAVVFLPALAFFVHFQGLCTFTSWLARRIPDKILLKNIQRARIMAVAVALWSLAPVLTVLADSLAIGPIGRPRFTSFGGALIGIAWSIATLFFIFSPLFWLGYTHTTMSRLSRALRRAKDQSSISTITEPSSTDPDRNE